MNYSGAIVDRFIRERYFGEKKHLIHTQDVLHIMTGIALFAIAVALLGLAVKYKRLVSIITDMARVYRLYSIRHI